MAAAAAAMAGAAAGSAAAYAAYGFSYQGSAPATSSNRASPVAVGAGAPATAGAYKQTSGVVLPQPVARYEGNASVAVSGDPTNVADVDVNGLAKEEGQDAT